MAVLFLVILIIAGGLALISAPMVVLGVLVAWLVLWMLANILRVHLGDIIVFLILALFVAGVVSYIDGETDRQIAFRAKYR